MSEVELLLVNSRDNCIMYTIQCLSDDMSEFEKFVTKNSAYIVCGLPTKFSFSATAT